MPCFPGLHWGSTERREELGDSLEDFLKDPWPHTHKHTHSFTHFVGCTSLRALGLLQEGEGNGPDASRQSDNHGRRKLTQTLDAGKTSPPWTSSFCTDSQTWPCSEGSS